MTDAFAVRQGLVGVHVARQALSNSAPIVGDKQNKPCDDELVREGILSNTGCIIINICFGSKFLSLLHIEMTLDFA